MKAITVMQPWAACIAAGAKLVENRARPVSHRGPLAIHAGQRWSRRGGHDDLVVTTLAGPDAPGPMSRQVAGEVLDVVFGAVIAVAELVDCHPADGCCSPWGVQNDDHGHPAHHLILRNVQPLDPPVPARGALGLWSIDLADRNGSRS